MSKKSVTHFLQTKAIPPNLRSTYDCVGFEFHNIITAQIVRSVIAAADFLSALKPKFQILR